MDYDLQKEIFIHAIKQMEIAGVLLKVHGEEEVECVYASQEFVEMMECETAQDAMNLLNGEGFIGATHSDDLPAVQKMFSRKVSDEGKKFLTIRKITATGKEIWCKVYYTFIDDFDEKFIYVTYTDITSNKIYSERLRTAYNAIGNNFYSETENTLAIFRVNLDRNKIDGLKGKSLFATDSVTKTYSEVVEQHAENYLIDDEREEFLKKFSAENLKKKFSSGQNETEMYLFSRRKDGRFCYVKISAVLTRHPITGEIIAFITETEANNDKVQEIMMDKILARQFDMVSYISNGKYGVVIGDAAQIEAGNIFPKTRTGIYSEYLRTQVFPVLHGDDDAKKVMAQSLRLGAIEKNLREGEPYVVNIVCKIDGEIYYKQFDFYSVDAKANFFILLKSDTTEIQRKQIEQNDRLKVALAEAKAANSAKTAFLSRISHEIRTPMNAIIGLDNIALHEENLSDKLKDHLEKIGSSAKYLLSLINDILDVSRIESGKFLLKNEEFSIRTLFEQLESLVESQCKEKNLQFDFLMSGKIRNFYIGDDMKLKQILTNVLSNAVKFTEPGGKISLSIECTAEFDGAANFKFVVKDSGIGIDKNYLPKIFEPFSQEDDKTTSRYGGSGLGLAITKNIVETMNGKISVRSEKNVGTEFTILLPLKISERAEENIPAELNPQNLSALIIDDDPVACESARNVLAEVGISADICVGVDSALEMIRLRHARRDEYNFILVDLRMPQKNGVELTHEIREIIGDDPTVIILTAFDWDDVEAEGFKAGVDKFMAKPLSATNVFYELEQTANRKKISAPKIEIANLTGRKILIVEDMEVNAQIMMMLLEMNGMESEHAENGKVAVDMFSASAPNYYSAVLMDIRMPIMDGLTSAMEIRKLDRPDAKKIPIIALTANAFDIDVQRSLQAGMNAHLAKPVEPELLLKTMRELIGRAEFRN